MFCILWCALIVCVSTKQQSCKLQTCFIRLKKGWSRSRGKQTLCLALFKIYSIYRLEKTPVKHLIFYVFFIFFSAARLKFSIFYLLQDDYINYSYICNTSRAGWVGWGGIIINVVVALKCVTRCGCFEVTCHARAVWVWGWGGWGGAG